MALTAPVVLLEIEGQRLPLDVTGNLVAFTYEDHEKELDLLEITLADPYLQLIDHPLLQEGHEVRARFGYADNLSPTKVAVIKEIGYDFPESGAPTITIKAYDKGCKLSAEAGAAGVGTSGRHTRERHREHPRERTRADAGGDTEYRPVLPAPSEQAVGCTLAEAPGEDRAGVGWQGDDRLCVLRRGRRVALSSAGIRKAPGACAGVFYQPERDIALVSPANPDAGKCHEWTISESGRRRSEDQSADDQQGG